MKNSESLGVLQRALAPCFVDLVWWPVVARTLGISVIMVVEFHCEAGFFYSFLNKIPEDGKKMAILCFQNQFSRPKINFI